MNYLALYKPIVEESVYKLSNTISQNFPQNKHLYGWAGVIATVICSLYAFYLNRDTSKRAASP